MCELTRKLRLCTCGEIIDADSNWTIKKFTGQDWMDIETGRCLLPDYSKKELLNAQSIQDQLNSSNCFDFDYTPDDKDVLNIKLKYKNYTLKYEFEYQSTKWVFVNSISDHLNKDLEIFKGKLSAL